MQKKKISVFIALIIVACVLFSGCKPDNTYIYEENSKVIDSIKSVEETPIEEVAFVLMGKIRDAKGYVINGTGITESRKIIKVTQNINTRTVKSGSEYYLYSESSGIVNSYHQAFFSDNKVSYTNSEEINESLEYNVCDRDEYSMIYGFCPDEILLCGYTVDEVTLINTEKINRDGDEYTFKFTLDGEKASNKMKIQMQTFGGLEEYPIFEELYITAVVDNNWKVEKIIVESKYKVSKKVLGDVNCTQRLENVFTEFNSQPIIENAEEFREKLK